MNLEWTGNDLKDLAKSNIGSNYLMNNSLASTREYNSSPFFCESANYKKYDLRDDLSSRVTESATSTTTLLCTPIHPFLFENIVVLVSLLTLLYTYVGYCKKTRG